MLLHSDPADGGLSDEEPSERTAEPPLPAWLPPLQSSWPLLLQKVWTEAKDAGTPVRGCASKPPAHVCMHACVVHGATKPACCHAASLHAHMQMHKRAPLVSLSPALPALGVPVAARQSNSSGSMQAKAWQ